MIYRKDRDNFILSCECHCGEGLSFSVEKDNDYSDYLYISLVTYGTNSDKTSILYNISDTIKNICRLIAGKNICRTGVCVSPLDIIYMKQWFIDQRKTAQEQSSIPRYEDFTTIFTNNKFIFKNGETIFIDIDKDFYQGDLIDCELCLYVNIKDLTFKEKLKQIGREFRRNRPGVPEIYLSRTGFIHFCDYMIENLKEKNYENTKRRLERV